MEPGDEFAGYRIERVLGTGGMGVVYLAQHPRLSRYVALKVMSGAASADEGFRARFEREARVIAELQHPNIVDVYDTGDADGRSWLSMPYIEGGSAAQAVAESGALAPGRVIEIGRQIASALDYAHSRGVLHRDVKPANILLDAQHGTALLADFGIARTEIADAALTGTGFAIGTPDYSSPEQLSARPLTGATDVYALSVTLFCLLTGIPPFGDATTAEKIGAHLHLPPPRASQRTPTLPPAVDEVLAHGMAKDPAARPATATELVDRLESALGVTVVVPRPGLDDAASRSTQVVTPTGPVFQPKPPPTSRTGLRVAIAAAIVVVLVAGGIGGYLLLRSSPDSTTADVAGVAEQKCSDALDAAGDAMEAALSIDPADMDGWNSRVEQVMTGNALDQMTQQVQALEDQIAQGVGRRVVAAEKAGGLQRCADDTVTVLIAMEVTAGSSGTAIEAQRFTVVVEMVDESGTWKASKVSPLDLVGAGSTDGGAQDAPTLPVPCGDGPVVTAHEAVQAAFSWNHGTMGQREEEIDALFTGAARESIVGTTDFVRGTTELGAQTVAIAPNGVGVVDCAADRASILMLVEISFALAEAAAEAPSRSTYQLVLDVVETGGRWKVAELDEA